MAEVKAEEVEVSREEQQEAIYKEILEGIQNVMTSDTFHAFLDTNSRLLSANNYSINNIILAYIQRPNASYLMGYEKWKEYGRQVKAGGKGIRILVPFFAYEKEKDGFYHSILNRLKKQLKENPNMKVASTQIGKSSIQFTLNRNDLMGWKLNGKEMSVLTEAQAKRFFDQKILGKIPVGYKTGTVFDVKDVFVPDHLWLKKGFKKEDMERDVYGKAIKNKKGEYWVKNTEERIKKFIPELDFTIPEHDSRKMDVFWDILVSVCQDRHVSVELKTRDEDEELKSGADGYFLRTGNGTPGEITIADDLALTNRCAVLLHEMGHADLHNTFDKIAGLSVEMREVQAEATAYMIGKQFGIETNTSSFQYLSIYTSGLEVESLQNSLQAIQRATNRLMLDITTELEKRSLNRQLEPVDPAVEEAIPKKEVDEIIKYTKSVVLDSMESVDRNNKEIDSKFKTDNDKTLLTQTILIQQRESLKNQSKEGELMLSLCEKLEKATTLKTQMDAVNLIDAAKKRIVIASQEYDRLEQEYTHIMAERQNSFRYKYKEDPDSALKELQATYPELSALSEEELQYISMSRYLSLACAPLLDKEPHAFVERAIAAVDAARAVQAKNGSFVEVSFYHETVGDNAIKSGMFLHPKTANKLIKETERKQKELAKVIKSTQDTHYSSALCYLSFFQFQDNEITGADGWLNIGEGAQKDLTEAFQQCVEPEVEDLKAAYLTAVKERVKEKLVVLPELPPRAEMETGISETTSSKSTDAENEKYNFSQWKNCISQEKAKEEDNIMAEELEQEKDSVSLD